MELLQKFPGMPSSGCEGEDVDPYPYGGLEPNMRNHEK